MTSSDIRVGESIEIRVVVAELPDSDGDVWCDIPGSQLRAWIAADALLAGRRIERPLQVGDRVRFNPKRVDSWGSNWRGEIVAIRRDKAFVDWEKGICDTRWALADLEPAPASEGGGT